MKAFLKFMYTDEIESKDIDKELLYAANKYDFKRLSSKCLIEISKSITDENVIEIIKTAYFLDIDDLFVHALDKLKKSDSNEKKTKLNALMKTYPKMASKITNLFLFGKK